MNHVVRQKGFTLIELMLAMSFISVLLIAIAMTVIQISNIYNRGILLKDVNQAGRSLVAELSRNINSGSSFTIEPGEGNRFLKQGDWGGRLCVGQYSYIWNYGKAIKTGDVTALNVYDSDIDPQKSQEIIRFVKVLDLNAIYCSDPSKKVDPSGAIELLSVGNHNLALHNFSISSASTAHDLRTGQRLYAIEFMLGTNDQAALLYDSGVMTSCKPPGETGSDLNYCSVNKFDIVVRAGSAVE